jgi:hypothetical protein
MAADSYEQACVSTRSGGFGIRRVADHGPAAFNASSKAIDKAIMSRLLESADRRNK